ncbi:MAG: hypothetical protein Q8P18_27655 [Pseudomonadota bacterium]|nr:hypothetical protein [Pseudomonadota bacterium]
MTDRSAVDTITGYFYQFDLSILSVLQLASATDSIEIECVEDIDIRTASDTTAVQCKYYAKTEYNHSVIKDAVMYMLSHFKDAKVTGKPHTCYMIRGHFSAGQEKLKAVPDVDFLKKHFLTYTSKKVEHYHHTELGLDDGDLGAFLGLLTIDVNAPEFAKQFAEVIGQLRLSFSCSLFSAEFFYYNNALRVIRELAIQQNRADRTITKKAFLDRVNTSSALFNEWFLQKKGKKQYLAGLRLEYFASMNVSPYERFFLVEVDPSVYVREELKDLIFSLSKKWAKTSKREPDPFCPYLFVQGISDAELLELKKDLTLEAFKFVDGHDYLGADFSASSIAQRATHSNGIRIKLLNTIANLKETLQAITKTRKVYQFHFGPSYFETTSPSVGHVKIHVESLSDIKGII